MVQYLVSKEGRPVSKHHHSLKISADSPLLQSSRFGRRSADRSIIHGQKKDEALQHSSRNAEWSEEHGDELLSDRVI